MSAGIEFQNYQRAYDEIMAQLEAVQKGELPVSIYVNFVLFRKDEPDYHGCKWSCLPLYSLPFCV